MPQSELKFDCPSADEFFSGPALPLADEAVSEVFTIMLGFLTRPVEHETSHGTGLGDDMKTAIIHFLGETRGSCELRMSSAAARSIASAMLGGMSVDSDDDSVHDALGELCNMIAGGWKKRAPELCGSCMLSPPSVISGRDYKVYQRPTSRRLSRTYNFDAFTFDLTLWSDPVVDS